MPIYGYACKNCDHTLDVLQKMSDSPLVDCPECGQSELKRQLSAPRFRLKGSGWYETDFKSGNQRNLAGDGKDKKSDKPDKADKADKPAKTETSKSDSAKKASKAAEA